jgi:hypothetical protein
MKKKVIIALLTVFLIAFASYKYVYQSHRDIANEKVDLAVTTSKLIADFSTNEKLANDTYLDKTIQVKGLVTSYNKEQKTFTVDEKLFGLLGESDANLKVTDSIVFKGRFIGYDELLEEVKMDQITIIK